MKNLDMRLSCLAALLLFVALYSAPGFADGSAVRKVYHPYVQALESEIELRTLYETDSGRPDVQEYQLGYGHSLSDNWFLELYVGGNKTEGGSLELASWEVEARWQLTEQGEYSADWGILFELEREPGGIWEAATGVLVEREWGRIVGAANLIGIYEWGGSVHNEFESELALQARFRHSQQFEPAIEFFSGQDYKGLGPLVMGSKNLGSARRVLWEVGVIFGLTSDSPDLSIKAAFEYEF